MALLCETPNDEAVSGGNRDVCGFRSLNCLGFGASNLPVVPNAAFHLPRSELAGEAKPGVR